MKTFEEVKEGNANSFSIEEHYLNAKISKADFYHPANKNDVGSLEYIKKIQDNIEEYTIREIGYDTNSLIEWIEKSRKMFWRDSYEDFVNKHVLETGAAAHLGLSLQDLMVFSDGVTDEAADKFRYLINTQFGTNIPLSAEEKEKTQALQELRFSEDELARDKAYVEFRDMQNNSGRLNHSVNFVPIAEDKKYQEAKARVEGVTR